MNYQQWLEVRKQGIGSSDAATACGLNPYMSMLELWMIKTGRMQQNIEDESRLCTFVLGQAARTLGG
jgi:predicted phage-related endonuclease